MYITVKHILYTFNENCNHLPFSSMQTIHYKKGCIGHLLYKVLDYLIFDCLVVSLVPVVIMIEARGRQLLSLV